MIDTLQRFRDQPSGRGEAYDKDYEAVAALKGVADAYEAGIIAVTHTRKEIAEDPFDEVSGRSGSWGPRIRSSSSTGTAASRTGALYVTGRDLPETTITVSFSEGIWSVGGRTDGIERAERGTRPTRVEKCAAWLRDFLGDYAWPDAEVLHAAEDKGFTLDNVKGAKAKLRKADPQLCSKTLGFQGAWWNWIGSRDDRKPDRPTPYVPTPHTPHTHESQQTQETLETGKESAESRESGSGVTRRLRRRIDP